MKMKLLPLFLMFVMIFSVVQPISAANLGDTMITGPKMEPLTNMRVHDGNSIELEVQLCEYERINYNYKNQWFPKMGKELVCQLYNERGQLVWSDTVKTSYYKAIATLKFPFLQNGKYNLNIRFDDPRHDINSPEKPCETSIVVEVVGKNHL